jgi:putative ABC transport system permease protein
MIVFTCSALLISLLGLIAMSIYYITQRKRDIAIRKVFGSSSMGEQSRLLRFSFVSILFSLLIAIPLILIGISQIDKAVTYESSFPIWVPVVAFVVVVVISLGSVWLISMNATRENPVNNLKTE